MQFTSYSFLLFLLVLFAVYYLIPKRFQWMLLLVASYVFYSFVGIKYGIYMLATTVSTFFTGRKLNSLSSKQAEYLASNKDALSKEEIKEYRQRIKSIRKRWILLCLLFSFGILAVLKYTDFGISNINSVAKIFNPEWSLPVKNFIIPLGISFYTFQSAGYLIDIYREKYKYESNFLKFALFISYFPQLVQGPISRFDDLKKTLFEEHSLDRENISFGFQRILWGYFKKLVIADRLYVAVKTIIGDTQEFTGVFVLLGMLFYAIELYADFSGGIDITLGISQALGIRQAENFNRPFFSKSIAEYWRRWHITLGTWFKDYMYYPVSLSKPVTRLSKFCKDKFGKPVGKRVPVYVSTLLIWFTTGLWHGASWNFVVWGLLNAVVIVVSHELSPLYERFHGRYHISHTFIFRLFQVVRTFWLMCFLRTLDCYPGVGKTFRMVGTVFTNLNIRELLQGGFMKLGLTVPDYIVIIAAVGLLLAVSLAQRTGSIREKIAKKPFVSYCVNFALFLSIIVFGAYGVGYDAAQFIYSRF
ncbi:MAG: MBOAT family protein [Eubacteriales bacterium]|nr:MBOAT family protein [Eubacteriales bacterium]